MSYTYNIDPKAMFEDRSKQFVSFGIPKADVKALQAIITDMWTDEPGGWAFEWSVFARNYLEAGNPLLSSLAYGFAKFPCLANEARRRAFQNQVVAYLAAAPDFPVNFERRTIPLSYRNESVALPVHLFSRSGRYIDQPVLLYSGGVDTYKMDSHLLVLTLAQRLNVTVLAFDMPGTGENPVPLNIQGDELILDLVKQARELGNGKVIHFGLSFGGNFAAMTGLSGAVDAAVVLGGPVDKAYSRENLERLPYGMPGIIGNDMGFDHEPSLDEFSAAIGVFSRRSLLDRHANSPMIVINGAEDVFVPQVDTLVFEGRNQTEVHLIPGTGHCASSKLSEALDLICNWLPRQPISV
jgi:esterase FrsA